MFTSFGPKFRSVDLVAREGLDMGVTSEQTQATIVGFVSGWTDSL